MGAAKTVAYMYTYNEYLYYYINAKDIAKVEEILAKRPNLIKDPLTAVSKVTALNQTAIKGNLEMAQLLIDKYGADVNWASPRGETPLIAAIKKNNIKMVELLLAKGAHPDYIDNVGYMTVEYAILQGLYEISYMLYPLIKNKQLRTAQQYAEIGQHFAYRYVDYEEFLRCLKGGVEPEETPNFFIRKRELLSDPVIDPRQTWKQWALRQMEFKEPPLVERASLPEQLRPENRRFGRLSHFLGKLTLTYNSQVPSFRPTQTELNPKDQMCSEQIEIKSVS